MRFYQYSVTNNQGQTVVGTLQADSSDAARLALSSAGYAVQQVTELATSSSSRVKNTAPASRVPQPRAATPAPVPITQARTIRRETPGPSPVLNNLPAAAPQPDTYKTKVGSDKDLFFLFSQLGSYLRSGVNPAQALTDLTKRSPAHFQDSLKHAAQIVSEGGRMSDAFEKYPYLYPPDIVGVTRAGEAAGFLPEAMDEIANKMEGSHRLKRRLKYFRIMFVVTIALTPVILVFINGSLKSIAAQDDANGSLPIASTLGSAIGTNLVHQLPIIFGIIGALWVFWAWFHSMPMRKFRHGLVIRTPVLGGRAMAESMARMTWAMGMLSKSGLSPQSTFTLAAQSVPNLSVREKLREEGQRMVESDKLSAVLRRSALLPAEYGNIVETGEVTGDVPRALEHVARATDADFQGRDATAVQSSSVILYVLLGVLILLACAILARTFYGGLITTLTRDG